MTSKHNRLRLRILGGFHMLCSVPPAVAAPTPYDGSWSMISGHCGTIKIGMAVKGGHISATGGKFVMHRIALAGRIAGGRDQDQSRGRPAQSVRRRQVQPLARRRRLERHRTFPRLLGLLVANRA